MVNFYKAMHVLPVRLKNNQKPPEDPISTYKVYTFLKELAEIILKKNQSIFYFFIFLIFLIVYLGSVLSILLRKNCCCSELCILASLQTGGGDLLIQKIK